MIGFNYQSFQYYTYQDLEELQQINKYDVIGFIQIDEEEKIIKYMIDRSKYVRLSDLIFSIKAKFIRFHLGQLLQLFMKMLNKIIDMKDQPQEHYYLDENRIWLEFENNSQKLSIVYAKIQYSIKFTGYQCKLYEQELTGKMEASEKILKIISQILLDFQSNKITCNKNDSYFQEIVNKIYDPIIESCQQSNITQTFNSISVIIQNNEYDEIYQTVNYDDKLIDHYIYSLRQYRLEVIKQEFLDCINKYRENTLILEQLLMQKIEKIGKDVDNYNYQKIKEEEEQQAIDSIETRQEERKNLCLDLVNAVFNNCFENIEKMYKFDISQEEKEQLLQNILEYIQNRKLLKYFENSIHFYYTSDQDQFCQNYVYIFSNLTKSIVNDELEMYIQLQILKLIDTLI